MNDEVKKKVRATFNNSRLAVYRDEQNQQAFLRAAEGLWRVIRRVPKPNREGVDWPKLKPGQRFDKHEDNIARLLVQNLTMPWNDIFGRFPSGKPNSVFYSVVNDMLASLGQNEVGEAALKSMISGRNAK